jgi:hypothetical protein
MLKALILSSAVGKAKILADFRGAQAHRFEWLKDQYSKRTGSALPTEVVRPLTLVDDRPSLLPGNRRGA